MFVNTIVLVNLALFCHFTKSITVESSVYRKLYFTIFKCYITNSNRAVAKTANSSLITLLLVYCLLFRVSCLFSGFAALPYFKAPFPLLFTKSPPFVKTQFRQQFRAIYKETTKQCSEKRKFLNSILDNKLNLEITEKA